MFEPDNVPVVCPAEEMEGKELVQENTIYRKSRLEDSHTVSFYSDLRPCHQHSQLDVMNWKVLPQARGISPHRQVAL
ncbi:hypothetical protein ElyMa_000470200 [Elysia marginata]|uniref:Uncharacterized protein n=1 Tax=Elysia marginata TaxID=1093978 RepID=A0AAV4FSB9_9GAST|nr:hypothetical protein ElyMa_000470200 [Elysia marginata]